MGLIYFVRKKKFRTSEGMKSLYYAIQRKLQVKGGKTERDLAKILSQGSARGEGDVLSILTDLPKAIEEILKNGESVTISGLGSFQTAITSDGFEAPEDVLPSEVRLSKIYFKPDRRFFNRVGTMSFFRYPLTKYFPKNMLRPETVAKENKEEKEAFPSIETIGLDNGLEQK